VWLSSRVFRTLALVGISLTCLVAAQADEEGTLPDGEGALDILAFLSTVSEDGKPLIAINGPSTQMMEASEEHTYVDMGAFCTKGTGDPQEADLGDRISVGGQPVQTRKPGTYFVKYYCDNEDGVEADEKTRTIIVTERQTPEAEEKTLPHITLAGSNPASMVADEEYIEPGFVCSDPHYGAITQKVTVTGHVDVHKPGLYALRYHCENNDGVFADPVTRTIRVYIESEAHLHEHGGHSSKVKFNLEEGNVGVKGTSTTTYALGLFACAGVVGFIVRSKGAGDGKTAGHLV